MRSKNVRVLNFNEITGVFETPFYILICEEYSVSKHYIINKDEYNRYACNVSNDFLGTDLWIEFENDDLKYYPQDFNWIDIMNEYIKLTIEENEESETTINERLKTIDTKLDCIIEILRTIKT